jgi:hypothetical protein
VQVSRLRKLIEADPAKPRFISGVGARLCVQRTEPSDRHTGNLLARSSLMVILSCCRLPPRGDLPPCRAGPHTGRRQLVVSVVNLAGCGAVRRSEWRSALSEWRNQLLVQIAETTDACRPMIRGPHDAEKVRDGWR